jgi:inosine-uridine nucleoside N-ribohydrolase
MSKILLSTDIGSDLDDALSLLVMMNHPGIDLRAIYTVNGDVKSRAFIAKHMVDLAERDIAVAIGEAEALSGKRAHTHYEDCFVENKYVDYDAVSVKDEQFLPPEQFGILPNAVEDMAKRLAKEKHSIFSIAPMTNIAILLRDHPESARKIERIYVMGGRFGDSRERNIEHNIIFDAHAAKIVFDSGIPLTMIPIELCEGFYMPAEFDAESAAGRYVAKMLRGFAGINTAQNYKRLYLKDNKGVQFVLHKLFQDMKIRARPEVYQKLWSHKEVEKLDKKLLSMSEDIRDECNAAFEPYEYWKRFENFLRELRDPVMGYRGFDEAIKAFNNGHILADLIEKQRVTDVHIADVYVPYCFLHRDKLAIEVVDVSCTVRGETFCMPGRRHEIVRNMDYGHFKEFVKAYLK